MPISLKQIHDSLEEEEQITLDHRLYIAKNTTPLYFADFHETYYERMNYPLVKDTYVALMLIDNYANGDYSAEKEVLCTHLKDVLTRTLGLYAVGPIDEYGSPEFGWRCFEGIDAPGALLIKETSHMFACIMHGISETDLDINKIISVDYEPKSNVHKLEI